MNIEEQKNRRAEYEKRIEAFEEIIEQQRPSEEYDNQLVRKMVKEIRVFSKERVVMHLKLAGNDKTRKRCRMNKFLERL